MKLKQPYLSGKFIFWISLLVIVVTVISVYVTGVHANRSITSNFYLSLSIISFSLFAFLTYGLYYGFRLKDDYKGIEPPEVSDSTSALEVGFELPDFEILDPGEMGEGILLSILLWLAISIGLFGFMILTDVVFAYSIVLILSMLYWLFFRALKLVFNKSAQTKGELLAALTYAMGYTIFYTGWMFSLVYLAQLFR